MPVPVAVTDAELGVALGLPTSDRSVRDMLIAAVADAVTDVEAYLGRAVLPREFTERGRWPTYNSLSYGGWNLTPLDEPVTAIGAVVAETVGVPAEPTGYYTVTYTAGIDCRDPDKAPIRRYIKAAAANSPQVLRHWESVQPRGATTSVSAEGQSISYQRPTLGGGGDPGTLAPGALPTLRSLDRWRLAGRRVFIRQGSGDAWPYGGPTWQ